MRQRVQSENDHVRSEVPVEAGQNPNRSLVERHVLSSAQTKLALRGRWAHMQFPMLLWLGYLVGSHRRE